ncbi:FtsQ-type POTRA domain-containing protein [Massilia sp. Dwa41.01b]|uniref:cell division protein FtsQ/DivIB n=1 Tax=unclassified Massilia TaxID=2609279 RepID=UPI0016036691|nr:MULTISPECIES: cell division protein FtsQ/DivIB [unclassified Massilia]QNA88041.1 FtsQ-type POTRA domain-containing protein [Massilia sp. Dwa41.01b]QNA98945.1 FtsQ-type POTRA domain-containing protein [Massilia sp. Se16.2.3]
MWHDVRALNATASALLAATLLAAIASGVWWLSQRPMFTLRGVRVESLYGMELKHVNELTVRNSVLGKLRGNFFTTDLDQVRTTFEAVPWVRRATVRREWPNQLIVEVEEHVALGTWGEGRLLSVKGDVFTANLAEADDDHELPAFAGPVGSEKEVLARFSELRSWFAPVQLVPQALSLSSRYAWTVKLDNGMSVELGREQDKDTVKARVLRLVGVYPQLVARLQEGRIDTIDTRYANGLALSSAALSVPADASKPVKAAKKKPSTNKTTKHI